MGEQKKKRFHMPHAYILIFLLIVLVAVLTWIIPSGEFQRTMVETSTGEREVVVAGTYHGVSKIAEDGTNLRQGIQAVLTAPALGIQNAIEVLAFVFIIGGVFQIMAKTNALNMGIRSIIDKLGDKEFLMIPILMILFGLGGTTYGMSDELVPFYLLVMPVVFAMGYDSMTTFMMQHLYEYYKGKNKQYAVNTQKENDDGLYAEFLQDSDFSTLEYTIPFQMLFVKASRERGIDLNIPKDPQFHHYMGSKIGQ